MTTRPTVDQKRARALTNASLSRRLSGVAREVPGLTGWQVALLREAARRLRDGFPADAEVTPIREARPPAGRLTVFDGLIRDTFGS
jgi:hypothetical protein